MEREAPAPAVDPAPAVYQTPTPAAHRWAVRDAAAQAVGRAQALQQALRRVAASSPTPEERAVRLVETALADTGAFVAVTYRLTGDEDVLEVAGSTHALDDLPYDGRDIPLSADLPACEAVRTERVVACETREVLLGRFPGLRAFAERLNVAALVALPARHMGRVHGAIVLGWDVPHRPRAAELVALRTLAGRLARGLSYARLYYAERAAHAAAERAREEAEVARRAAEAANRAKDDFLAVVSHELRTPLQAILGFSDLLDAEIAGPLAPRQRDYVRRVQAAGGHLLDTIENLLGFARSQAGKEVVAAAPFDAAATVAQVLDIAAPLATRRGIALAQEGAARGVVASTDEKKVRQIVTNLVGNAVKFTERGRVTVGVAVVPGPDGGEWLRIAVRDTGIGISAEELPRVFDPFVQVTGGPGVSATTRPVGGTGLGLSIVQQLARLLGGDVTASSEEGRGSEFVVEVPRVFGEG